jgi:hypothetical protein
MQIFLFFKIISFFLKSFVHQSADSVEKVVSAPCFVHQSAKSVDKMELEPSQCQTAFSTGRATSDE